MASAMKYWVKEADGDGRRRDAALEARGWQAGDEVGGGRP